jgi:hypothetical protein
VRGHARETVDGFGRQSFMQETALAYASPRYLASRNRKTGATAESGSGLVEIAVHDFGRVPFALQ